VGTKAGLGHRLTPAPRAGAPDPNPAADEDVVDAEVIDEDEKK